MIKILHVLNKKIPQGDYRLQYEQYSEVGESFFAMPEQPAGFPEEKYICFKFEEGFKCRYLIEFLRFVRFLRHRRSEFDVIHYYSTNLVLLGPVIAKLAKIPSVFTVTGLGRVFTSAELNYKLLRPLYNFLMRISVQIAEGVFFQNQMGLAAFQRQYAAYARKMVYVGSGIDFPVLDQKDFEKAPLEVLLITRLLPDKGVEDFIKVAERLQDQGFSFTLAGPYSQGFDDLYDSVLEADQQGVIHYTGELGDEEIQACFSRAHVFYFPSSYGEGLSRVMLEAGFSRTCPLAYPIPANLDLVKEGAGYLIEVNQLGEVCELLQKLKNDRGLLAAQADAFQAHIVAQYTMPDFAARMDRILMELGSALRRNMMEN